MPQADSARTFCIASIPSMSGRPRSMMHRSGVRLRRRRSRSPPLRHQAVRNEKSLSACSMMRAMSGSSSTTTIIFPASLSFMASAFVGGGRGVQGARQLLAGERFGEDRDLGAKAAVGGALAFLVGIAADQQAALARELA